MLPAHQRAVRWIVEIDTRVPDDRLRGKLVRGGDAYRLDARSLAVFRLRKPKRSLSARRRAASARKARAPAAAVPAA
ncbi:MAG: hypothetical protein HYR51_17575 [Candidatus Rokubacteria bacterium]|nr:hypothetical protein [Candidatus Rokubacteria bacterium]